MKKVVGWALVLMLILVASLGAYSYQRRLKETLERNITSAWFYIAIDGVDWARIDCEEPDLSNRYTRILRRAWLKKFEMGWIDLQCNGKVKRFSRTNLSRGDVQEKARIKGYEDTVGNLLQ